MEPKNAIPSETKPNMERKNSPTPTHTTTSTMESKSPFNTLLYPPSHEAGKEDLYSILCKGQNGPAQAGTADGKSQWTPAKSRSAKDSKHPNPNDSVDTSCFGSSVHYGGREYFYGSSTTSKQATESNEYKVDNKDPATDSHGDWWQGSFYY